MKFTNKRPETPGWYFASHSGDTVAIPVKVVEFDEDLAVYEAGRPWSMELGSFLLWSEEPIELPTVEKEGSR